MSVRGELGAAAVATLRRLRGEADEDEWGFDPDYARSAQAALDVLFDRFWRVTVTGGEHLPAAGPALVVANHAGLLPWDATMITTAILRATGRRARILVMDRATTMPWGSLAVRRFGGVAASVENALRLLDQGHVVIAFPEGEAATAKPYAERYRLQRFGRGGFVEIALRAGVSMVPTAVVGSEEAYPRLGALPAPARLPRLPVTPLFPLLGPLGLLPLPSRWRIAFGGAIDLRAHADRAGDRGFVLDQADELRDRIQAMLLEELVARGRTFR